MWAARHGRGDEGEAFTARRTHGEGSSTTEEDEDTCQAARTSLDARAQTVTSSRWTSVSPYNSQERP